MVENSKIEWTEHTFNPWIGCTHVSPGCKNCYAEALMDTRYKRVKWGTNNPRMRTSESNWKKPVQWNKAAKGLSPKVFCASLSDWLDHEVDRFWLRDLMALIQKTPKLTWLLLTKRPEAYFERIEFAIEGDLQGSDPLLDHSYLIDNPGKIADNVWVGTTAEDQRRYNERIDHLLKIPADIRFLSVEPMISLIMMRDFPEWIICGGESGPGKRPMELSWARTLRNQCKNSEVPFFFKQVDKVKPIPQDLNIRQFPKQKTV